MTSDHWSARLIGIPWRAHGRDASGCDCWGLVRLAYAEHGVALPCLSGSYSDRIERSEVLATIDGQRDGPWFDVPRDQTRAYDMLVFGGGWPHVGLAIDAARMLHVVEGRTSEIIAINAQPWRNRLQHVARYLEFRRRGE